MAGADEAGRGCLAGPLVAAGVLFDYDALTTRELRALGALNDSKQHSAQGREELYPLVLRSAARVCVVSRCVRGIDARGLHKTNLAALRDALRAATAEVRGDVICLVDGFSVSEFEHPQRAIVDGDATSAAIAAASIVAKVTRDRFMQHADVEHPGWSFAEHVGYLHAVAPRSDPASGRFAPAPHVIPVAGLSAARALEAATVERRRAWAGADSEDRLAAAARAFARALLRPFGYLAFVLALGALSSAARLLGDEHELGFFAGRLSGMIWRYPEITRRGVQMAWLTWAVLLAVAVSPADPITSRWDEALLVVLGACVIWRRTRAGHQAGH